MKKFLEVKNLSVSFSEKVQRVFIVRDVSFSVFQGERIGLIGESGCGKTTLAHAMANLLPSYAQMKGSIYFANEMIKQSEIAIIFQDPFLSLNPTMKIGKQIQETFLFNGMKKRKNAKEKSIKLLNDVGLPEHIFSSYPHQLSGGMCQRIMIAIALAKGPKILLADEPTTALDVIYGRQILELLKKIQKEKKMSVFLNTHDIGVISTFCDRLFVMYGGRIVEAGKMKDILIHPMHPYTRYLLDMKNAKEKKYFSSKKKEKGCPFSFCCPHVMDKCKHFFPKEIKEKTHRCHCFLYSKEKNNEKR